MNLCLVLIWSTVDLDVRATIAAVSDYFDGFTCMDQSSQARFTALGSFYRTGHRFVGSFERFGADLGSVSNCFELLNCSLFTEVKENFLHYSIDNHFAQKNYCSPPLDQSDPRDRLVINYDMVVDYCSAVYDFGPYYFTGRL